MLRNGQARENDRGCTSQDRAKGHRTARRVLGETQCAVSSRCDPNKSHSGSDEDKGNPFMTSRHRLVSLRVPKMNDQTRGSDRIEEADQTEGQQSETAADNPDGNGATPGGHRPAQRNL
jgi:hypothetical protein